MLKKPINIFNLTNLVYLIAVFLAFSLTWQTVGVVVENYSLQQRVDELSEEVEVLELENQKLSFDIKYYSTDTYLELAAREHFNLKAPGERVVFVSRTDASVATDPENDKNSTISIGENEPQTNVDKWLFFLFSKEPS